MSQAGMSQHDRPKKAGILVQPTPHDWATALVLEEIARESNCRGAPILTTTWRDPFSVRASLRKSTEPNVPTTSSDIVAALDYLAMRGLVDERHTDGGVERGAVQHYRWSRCATAETLARFAAPPRLRLVESEDADTPSAVVATLTDDGRAFLALLERSRKEETPRRRKREGKTVRPRIYPVMGCRPHSGASLDDVVKRLVPWAPGAWDVARLQAVIPGLLSAKLVVKGPKGYYAPKVKR